MKKIVAGVDALEDVAREVIEQMHEGVVILRGDLAAGKTTLVKAIAKILGVSEDVTSPTFSLQQCYGEKIYHYDIYNHGVEHFISLGMLEELEREGLHFVEWGDDSLIKILTNAGISALIIDIEKMSDNKREYRMYHAHA